MDKHTPSFRENIAIHVDMLLDDEMRAHAYASKEHELDFQVFRVLGGYRQALNESKAKDTRIAEFEARIVEIAGLFGVCDGGQYINDWKTVADKYNRQSQRITELERMLDAERERYAKEIEAWERVHSAMIDERDAWREKVGRLRKVAERLRNAIHDIHKSD